MPTELKMAIAGYQFASRQTMIKNWDAIGEDGRQALTKYINRAWFRRGRRTRAKLAAEQLFNPNLQSTLVWPSGGIG